jgi:TonB family protein
VPYNPERCHFNFRWFLEFGGGQIRDRGAHVMSVAMFCMASDSTGPVSIEATVSGGGVAVPVTAGPTAARGRSDLPASAPVGDNEGPTAPVDVVEVDRAPRVIRQPSSADLRALYPEQARREGLEADDRLELLVDETGRVAQVKMVEGAGNGFDEASTRAARAITFAPGQRGGRPVPVWIPWTLKFRLDG